MSMKLIRNKYVPDLWLVDGKYKPWAELNSWQKRQAFLHGKNQYSVDSRPLLKRLIDEATVAIAKFGGSFTAEEFLAANKKAEAMGHKIQWLIREAHGGGRGARAWGYVYLAKENLIEKYLKERNILDEFRSLPKTKQISRIQKLIGECEDFPVKPRVRIGKNYPFEGLIFATPSFMEKCNIPFGCKTTGPVKGLMVPTTVDSDEWDIVVPANENKIKLSEEKLSENIKLFRRLAPQYLFSRNLKRKFSNEIGRNPQEGFDMGSILNRLPKVEWLQEARDIYEGKKDKETVAELLFSYEDKNGEVKYTPVGEKLLAGESLFSDTIWPEARKALLTIAKKSIQPRIEGAYGVVMPRALLRYYKVKGEQMTGWLTRFPWTLPILTTVEIWNHCIFVNEDLWKTFGGDYDGDQGAVFSKHVMHGDLIWSRDKKWIKTHMVLPPKEDTDSDDRSVEDIIAHQLDMYSGCGRTFNNAKITVDAARMAKYNRKKILAMEIKLQAIEVQPYIDGFKYKTSDKTTVKSAVKLAKDYGSSVKHVPIVRTFFRTIRGRNTSIDDLVVMAKIARDNSLSYYEKLVNLFKGWQRGKYENKENKDDVRREQVQVE